MHYLFAILIFIHGIIHSLGFIKAYRLANVSPITSEISKLAGTLWLLVAIGCVVTGILYVSQENRWFVLAFFIVFVSQMLIITTWQDAKFGTLANGIILLMAIASYGDWSFKDSYIRGVREVQSNMPIDVSEIVSEQDLAPLPVPVQNYLRYVGVVGKPKISNTRIELEGEMRQKGGDWFSFRSEQYNGYPDPFRLFFMDATVKGLPTAGYHEYKKDKAKMEVKLFSLFPVSREEGVQLFQAETVTVFNDMCLLAPSTLIDPNIEWEDLDDYSVRAFFSNHGVTISAVLIFNEEYQLINFISEDRYAMTDEGLKKFTFSTPIKGYEPIAGYNLFSYAEAIWDYPDGEFVYGKFRLKSMEVNLIQAK